MKIYTKTGDTGTTSLIGGTRVQKCNERIDCYGTIDELNSWIGLICDQKIDQSHKTSLLNIQNKLFVIGAHLATDPSKKNKVATKLPLITNNDIIFLETEIDEFQTTITPLTHFILPGGHPTVSYCHIARTVCRRAERLATKINNEQPLPEYILMFLNRLSDYLFVLARKLSKTLQVEEIKWQP